MRRLLFGVLALSAIFAGCAQSGQGVDLLAPRVAPAEPQRPAVTAIAVVPAATPLATAPAVTAQSPAGPAPTTSSTSPTTILSAAPTVVAPATPAATAAPAKPVVQVAPITGRALLEPMTHEFETWNNCAPVTSEMVLSYYGIQKKQTEIAPVLRPNAKNFSVRIDQIGAYLGQFGLQSQPLIGGTLPLLKVFASNGIPVVVEDQLSLQDDYGHFRVVRGYDDSAGVLIFGDSYFGATNRIAYNLYAELWKRHDYAFMPVFRPEQAALVQAILGPDFDPRTNLDNALKAARTAVADQPSDGFAWLNLGADLYKTGQFPEAIDAWNHAKTLKITPRTLWYTIWPAAAYNQLGRYQEAIDVTATPLATDPNNAEALLERGNAYRGLGNLARARADYAQAIDVDPSLAPAKQALASLG